MNLSGQISTFELVKLDGKWVVWWGIWTVGLLQLARMMVCLVAALRVHYRGEWMTAQCGVIRLTVASDKALLVVSCKCYGSKCPDLWAVCFLSVCILFCSGILFAICKCVYFYSPWNRFSNQSYSFATTNLFLAYPSVLWHCWLGDRKGIRPIKKLWWHSDWSFARLIAPVVTTTSVNLSFNKIQNIGDILVLA